MDPHVVEIIAPLVSLLGMGTVGLIGMKMWLRSKVERQQLSGRLDMERLEESLCSLHDNMLSLRGRLSELHERVDFAERFLTEGGEKRSRRKELSETPP
jgi:predicted nuclease with TOPRIM domain